MSQQVIKENTVQDIPDLIFDKFAEKLKNDSVPLEIVDQLHKMLKEKERYNQTDIENVIFSQNKNL